MQVVGKSPLFTKGCPLRKLAACPNFLVPALLMLASSGLASAQTVDGVGSNSSETAPKDTLPVDELTKESPRSYSLLEIVGTSMFGKQPDPEREWTPLSLTDLGNGWDEPWIQPPNGSSGALRQGWVNTYDAFFNRMLVGIYSYTACNQANPNENVGTLLYETPISRRYMFGLFVPFVDSLQNGPTAFGDITYENRFILEETQDATFSFNLNGRVPTGVPALGGGRTSVNPYLSFFRDIGRGFSLRGTGGIDVPVDSRPDGITSTLIGQLGIGQTLTPHDVPLLGDFTYYVTANFREYLGIDSKYFSLTPGIRTHLGSNFWLLGGVEVPLAGPKLFSEKYTFVLVKGF